MTAHTPGPWRTGSMIIENENGDVVVDTTGRTRRWEMTFANAALIAAAPDMLKVLHFITTDFCYMQLGEGTREEILSAIAKAEATP